MRKERKKVNTGNKRNNQKKKKKKKCYSCESDNHEIKDCDSGKNISTIDRASRRINKEELKYRLGKHGKIKCRMARKARRHGRLGNVRIVCFETKEESNMAI